MKAVLTADIINSTQTTTKNWLAELKKTLAYFGTEEKDWEIYRGDEFQIILSDPKEAFRDMMVIKASLNSKNFDARMALGLGMIDDETAGIKQSNGSAFVNSGRTLDFLKTIKTQNILITSDHGDLDENLNLLLLLLESTFDRWTAASACAVSAFLKNKNKTQQEIAEELNITQGAYSRALKRANIDALIKTEQYFIKKIAQIL